MNLRTIKSSADMKLDGINIDCEFRDKSLAAVTMTDKSGNLVRFVLENYAVKALVPAPPEKKTVHVVTGVVRGIGTEIREQFDESYEAQSRHVEIQQADVCDRVEVSVEEVEIPF